MSTFSRDFRWALKLAFVVLALNLACCQPIQFQGPQPSRLWGAFLFTLVGVVIIGAVLQVPLAIRHNRRQAAEDAAKAARRAERQAEADLREKAESATAADVVVLELRRSEDEIADAVRMIDEVSGQAHERGEMALFWQQLALEEAITQAHQPLDRCLASAAGALWRCGLLPKLPKSRQELIELGVFLRAACIDAVAKGAVG